MAFDLKRMLKVMLFASNGPLSVKDIQTAVTRFHEQATSLPLEESGEEETIAAPSPAVSAETPHTAETEASRETPEASATGDETAAETLSVPGAPTAAAESIPLPLSDEEENYRDVPRLIPASEIREAMDAIAAEFKANHSEVLLSESSSGWRLVTHPHFARWVRLLRNEPPPARLGAPALETLAVVAYRQPVTRGEIEQIRGVSAEAGITKLLERELIYIVGRADLPGRPIQYGTTDAFLEFVGIKSLDELPASDVLSPRQIDAWLQTSSNAHPAGDAEMGLDETEEDQLNLQEATTAPQTPPAESSEKPSPQG